MNTPGYDFLTGNGLIRVDAAIAALLPGTIQFNNSAYSVNENGTAVNAITLTRTGGSNGAVSVLVTPSNGTATSPADFTATPITVNFADGETSKTVVVPIVDDTLFEGNETVNLTLSSPTGGATLGTQTTSVLTIADNDPAPMIQFSAPTYGVNENGTVVDAITLVRFGGSNGGISVTLTPSNGTATSPADFTATPIVVNFAEGETSKTVAVPIVDDTLFEGNETVNLTLSNATGGAILGAQTTSVLTIVENDTPPVIQFDNSTYSVNENGTAVNAITLTRTGGSNGGISVTLTPSNDTATSPADFTATPIVVNFAEGENSKTVTVPIVDDTAVEGDETVNLTLSNATGGAVLGSPTTAVLTIIDNDFAQPGTIQFNNANYSVNEDGTAINTITLSRTGGSNGAVGVTLTPSNGTATSPADFNNVAITVNFANGETSKTVAIPIVDDTLVEGNETVNLTLSNATGGAVLGTQATAVLTIVDNDVAGPTITGTSGSDRLNGTPGNDTLIGLGGNDRLDGKAGIDTLIGGLGNDSYFVDNSGDVVVENPGEGSDDVRASVSYALTDNVENLTLAGIENLNGTGNSLNNRIVGNLGNNILNGGAGQDTLLGLAGADIFVFQFGESVFNAIDRIIDFAIGTDKIDLLTQGGSDFFPVNFTRAADFPFNVISDVVTGVFADADGALAGSQPLAVDSAVLVKASTATYLIVNDGVAGFQSANDLVVNLTGITGTLPALGAIPVNSFFI
jgi:Ca2+-binding RTX toxin-like protein